MAIVEPHPSPSPTGVLPEAEDVRCADCGYGAVLALDRPRCPMCGGLTWVATPPPAAARLGLH